MNENGQISKPNFEGWILGYASIDKIQTNPSSAVYPDFKT